MYPRHIRTFALLPALLGVLLPSIAVPIPAPGSLSNEAKPLGLSSATTPLVSRNVGVVVVERDYPEDVFSRALDEDIFPRAKRPKLSKAEAQARKEGVREDVQNRQTENAERKVQLHVAAAQLTAPYGRPRRLVYNTEVARNGRVHITGGFRKQGRERGFRLPKQHKTPKDNFIQGQHLADARAVASQAAASARKQQRKADGQARFADAHTRHQLTLAHGNMPHRLDQFPILENGVLDGTHVRQGAFNLGVHDGQGGRYPDTFRNQEQGPPDNRHVPLPHMVGAGLEYPIQHGGYHPDAVDPNQVLGPSRGIYQANPAAPNGNHGGYNFQGVVSHDTTRVLGDPGYNDHIPAPRIPAPVGVPLASAAGTVVHF